MENKLSVYKRCFKLGQNILDDKEFNKIIMGAKKELAEIIAETRVLVRYMEWEWSNSPVESYIDFYEHVFCELVMKNVERWWRYKEIEYEKEKSIDMKKQPSNEFYRFDMLFFSKYCDFNDLDDYKIEEMRREAKKIRTVITARYYLLDFMTELLLKDMLYRHPAVRRISKEDCYNYYMKWIVKINNDKTVLRKYELNKIIFVNTRKKYELRVDIDDKRYYLNFTTKEVFDQIWSKMIQIDGEKDTVDLEIACIMFGLFVLKCNGTKSPSKVTSCQVEKIDAFLKNTANDKDVLEIFVEVLDMYLFDCQRFNKKIFKENLDDDENIIFKLNGGAVYKLYNSLDIRQKMINHRLDFMFGEFKKFIEIMNEDISDSDRLELKKWLKRQKIYIENVRNINKNFSIIEFCYCFLKESLLMEDEEKIICTIKLFADAGFMFSSVFADTFLKEWEEFCEDGYKGINLDSLVKETSTSDYPLKIIKNRVLPIKDKEKQDTIISTIAIQLLCDEICIGLKGEDLVPLMEMIQEIES